MQKGGNNLETEKRSGNDRREQPIGLEFPFIDSHGHLVTHERRLVDRRKSTLDNENNTAPEQKKNYA